MSNVNMSEVVKAELQMAERLVVLKYPHLQVKPGSMVQELAHPVYGNKRRVTLVCECGVEVERATSDLHTFLGCEVCKKAIRKKNALAKKVAVQEALARAGS